MNGTSADSTTQATTPQIPKPIPAPEGGRPCRAVALVGAARIAAVVVVAFALVPRAGGAIVPAAQDAAPTAAAAAPTPEADAATRALVPEAVGVPLEVYPAGSTFVVGRERFAIGLVDPGVGPLEAGAVDLLFFKIADNQGTLTETQRTPFMPYGVEEAHTGHAAGEAADTAIRGVYVARPTFDAPGTWGVVARVTQPDGAIRAGQADFAVVADSAVPGPGEAAVASETLKAATADEAARICTADPVDDMHALSLAEAVRSGKPTVVLFATPALCATRTCGPSLEALKVLKERYGAEANFVHVEIYPERDYEKPAAAVAEWSLPSEPWLFVIDGAGTVVERFEGGIGLTELDPAVRALIA